MYRTHKTLDIHRKLPDVQNKVENCPCFFNRRNSRWYFTCTVCGEKGREATVYCMGQILNTKNTCSCHFMHDIHAFDCMAVHCSPHDVTCHATPCHAMTRHDMTPHDITSHDMICHDTTRQDITVHHMTSDDITSYEYMT